MAWDPENERCDHAGSLQSVHISGAVYLAEQSTVSVYESLRGVAILPSIWTCHPDSQYCWSQENGVHYAHFQYRVLAGNTSSLAGVFLYTDDIVWRCTQSGKFALRAVDDMTTTPNTALSPFPNFCVSCEQFCAPHGRCVNGTTCECQPGYSGRRCRTLTAVENSLQSLDNFFPYFSRLNLNCSSDSQCASRINNTLCYHDLLAGGERKCWCRLGYAPHVVLVANTTGTLSFACVPSAMRHLFGAPLGNTTTRASTVHIILPERKWIFAELALSYGAAFSTFPVSYSDDGFRVNTTAFMSLWRCKNETDFFVDQHYGLTSPFDVHCLGYRAVCKHNATASANGECICSSPRFQGTFCEKCASGYGGLNCSQNATICRNNSCNNHGECLANGTCACDQSRWFGPTCNISDVSCRQTRCSGRGRCEGEQPVCLCDRGYFGRSCQWNATACSVNRCSSRGTCLAQTHGCQCPEHFFVYANCSVSDCSSRGQWTSSSGCNCSSGAYSGANCEINTCGSLGAWNQSFCQCAKALVNNWPFCSLSEHNCPPFAIPDESTHFETCVCPPNRILLNNQCRLLCYPNGTLFFDSILDKCLCRQGYEGTYCESLRLIRPIAAFLRAPPIIVETTIHEQRPFVPDVLTHTSLGVGMIIFLTFSLFTFATLYLLVTFQTATAFRPTFHRITLKKKIS